MIRPALAAALLLLAGCHRYDADNAAHSEVPESTLSLIAEGSPRVCSSADVQDVLARQLRPDAAGLSPAPAAPVLAAARAAIRSDVTEMTLATADRGVPSVTCDAQLKLSAPDYGAAAPGPVALRYTVRPASAASDTIDVAIAGTAPAAAARALLAQVVQRIAERQGTRPPVSPGYDGPVLPGAGGPPDITADQGDAAPLPAPVPAPSAPAASPSFDCAGVTSATLRTVCGDRGLARLDRRLADRYRRRLAEAAPEDRADLVADERDWIAGRQRCGADPDCIAAAYQDRLAALSDVDE